MIQKPAQKSLWHFTLKIKVQYLKTGKKMSIAEIHSECSLEEVTVLFKCFYRLPLSSITVSMRLGRFAKKSDSIFPGMKWHSLWQSSHSYSWMHGFFWQTLFFSSVYIYLMVFKSGLWTGQTFTKVTFSSAKQFCAANHGWNVAPSYWKSLLSSQSAFNLFYSNWM